LTVVETAHEIWLNREFEKFDVLFIMFARSHENMSYCKHTIQREKVMCAKRVNQIVDG
jgi:hypothetical protein